MRAMHWNRNCPWLVSSLKCERSFKCFAESRPKFLVLFSLVAVTEGRQEDYFIKWVFFGIFLAAVTKISATVQVLLNSLHEETGPNTENWRHSLKIDFKSIINGCHQTTHWTGDYSAATLWALAEVVPITWSKDMPRCWAAVGQVSPGSMQPTIINARHLMVLWDAIAHVNLFMSSLYQ